MQDRIIKEGVFANPIVAIETSDGAGRITEVNAAYCRLLGYDEAELLRLTITDLCHPDDIDRELNERRRLIDGERDHLTFRKRYLTKSGKILWGNTNITAVRDTAKDNVTLVTMMVDATDQHRQELLQQGRTNVLEQLYRDRSLEEICAAIVESIEAVEEGLMCSILRLNHATGRLHKAAAPSLPEFYNEAIEGMRIGPEVGSCGAAAFTRQRIIVADILNHPYWARVRKLIEKTALRSCWSQPIFSNDGSVLGTFAIYYNEPREPGPFELELINSAADLTALAINHKRAQEELRQSVRLKSEFISTAAHELSTPMTSIMGFAELLRKPQEFGPFTDQENDDFLNIIYEKAEILSRIVSDLLDFSKMDSGYTLSLQKKSTPIRQVLSKVVGHFERYAPHHTFVLRLDEDFPDELDVDEGRIVQVLENLLSNAVKYSPAGGPIQLLTTVKPESIRISVADHGIGMNEDQVNRVFEKFYRADATDTAVNGLGLGMSIAREIVRAHNGEIKVESALGEGTSVHVTLPHS